MVEFLIKLLLVARCRLKSRAKLEAENLVLRQQVIVLSRKCPSRVRLRNIDRMILGWLYPLFPSILNAITVVKPETVIGWHRRGFLLPTLVRMVEFTILALKESLHKWFGSGINN
jgi:hypothetical protein